MVTDPPVSTPVHVAIKSVPSLAGFGFTVQLAGNGGMMSLISISTESFDLKSTVGKDGELATISAVLVMMPTGAVAFTVALNLTVAPFPLVTVPPESKSAPDPR